MVEIRQQTRGSISQAPPLPGWTPSSGRIPIPCAQTNLDPPRLRHAWLPTGLGALLQKADDPDDPVGGDEDLEVPFPGRRSIPHGLPTSRMARGCWEAGAFPAGPWGVEGLMRGAWLGAAICGSQAAGGEGPDHEGRIKTQDSRRKEDGGGWGGGETESPASRDGRSLLHRAQERFPGQRHGQRMLALWQELRQSRA